MKSTTILERERSCRRCTFHTRCFQKAIGTCWRKLPTGREAMREHSETPIGSAATQGSWKFTVGPLCHEQPMETGPSNAAGVVKSWGGAPFHTGALRSAHSRGAPYYFWWKSAR